MRTITADVADMIRRGSKYYRFFFWSGRLDSRFRNRTPEQLSADQLQKLLAIVRHAARNLPFYRELYRDIPIDSLSTWDDIRRLPTVTKHDLRRNFPDRIVFQADKARPADYGRSSGTTGEAVQFLHQANWKKNTYNIILWQRTGWLSPRTGILQTPQCSASSCSLTDQRPTLEDRLRDALIRSGLNPYYHLPSSTDIFREPDEYFEGLRRILAGYRTEVLCGASNYLGQFARALLRAGRTHPLRAVICSSELLLSSVRDEIERAFSCPVYNHYGCSEIPGVADQCEEGRWHVRTDTVCLELTRDGLPAEPGELGTVLLTDLDNYRMPLIRYEVGDLAIECSGACPCGRRNQTLVRVEGRQGDAWQGLGGQLVSAAAIGDAAHRAGLQGRYRVVQQTSNEVGVEWVKDDMASDWQRVQQRLAGELQPLLGCAPQVEIQPVKYIKAEKSNKYRLIASQVQSSQVQSRQERVEALRWLDDH